MSYSIQVPEQSNITTRVSCCDQLPVLHDKHRKRQYLETIHLGFGFASQFHFPLHRLYLEHNEHNEKAGRIPRTG